jgi:hypothetical protein
MASSGARIRAVLFVVLSGILAAVIIAVLLLFGVEPRLVFAPGFMVMAWCKRLGLHVPKAAGVLSTVFAFWVVIVAIRFVVMKLVRRSV